MKLFDIISQNNSRNYYIHIEGDEKTYYFNMTKPFIYYFNEECILLSSEENKKMFELEVLNFEEHKEEQDIGFGDKSCIKYISVYLKK